MFEALIKNLDTLESGLAKNALRNRKTILGLLNDISGQVTTLTQKGAALPKGSRSELSNLSRVVRDCHSGVSTGRMTYQGLREASRDIIGKINKKLKLFDEGLFEGTDQNAPKTGPNKEYATEALIKGKVEKLSQLMLKKYVTDIGTTAKAKVSIMERVKDLTPILSEKFAKFTQKELVELNPQELVDNYTIEEIAGLTLSDLREYATKIPDDVRALNDSYKKFYRRLPTALSNPFSVIQYPVVPLFADFTAGMDNGKLEHAGFKVSRVGEHYIVLEDQYLLVLDTEKLGIKSAMRTDRKGRLKSVKNSDDLHDPSSPSFVINEVLELINGPSNTKYVVGSSVPIKNPRNPKHILVWIVSQKARNALDRVLRSAEVKWDIPRQSA